MPPGKAPVEHVGGTRNEGPWPEAVEEIAAGEQYEREVPVEGGGTERRTVTVKDVVPIVRADGTETDGYVVRMEHGGGV